MLEVIYWSRTAMFENNKCNISNNIGFEKNYFKVISCSSSKVLRFQHIALAGGRSIIIYYHKLYFYNWFSRDCQPDSHATNRGYWPGHEVQPNLAWIAKAELDGVWSEIQRGSTSASWHWCCKFPYFSRLENVFKPNNVLFTFWQRFLKGFLFTGLMLMGKQQ